MTGAPHLAHASLAEALDELVTTEASRMRDVGGEAVNHDGARDGERGGDVVCEEEEDDALEESGKLAVAHGSGDEHAGRAHRRREERRHRGATRRARHEGERH